jgi:hypothetical protein
VHQHQFDALEWRDSAGEKECLTRMNGALRRSHNTCCISFELNNSIALSHAAVSSPSLDIAFALFA